MDAIGSQKSTLCYAAITKIIKRAFKQAGVKKRVYPHLFRHSRASIMAGHLTEFQMNHYFGWVQGSDMPATYVHLNGKDLDAAIMRMNGMDIPPEQKSPATQAKICPRCNAGNIPDAIYCSRCAEALDAETVLKEERKRMEEDNKKMRVNELMLKLLQDPSLSALMADRIAALGLGHLLNQT